MAQIAGSLYCYSVLARYLGTASAQLADVEAVSARRALSSHAVSASQAES